MNLLKTLLVLLVASLLETVYASDDIENVASEVRRELYKLLENTTNFTYLKNAELDLKSFKKRNGTDIIQQVTNELTTMFNVRLSTVKELADYAEKQYENYTTDYSLDSNYEYFDAAEGDSNQVSYDEQFSKKVEVNLNMSVVQTPTDLYQYAVKVVNSIEWTKTLDKKFKEIFNKIETKYKAWHYIGLTNGVFRTYPASLWRKNACKNTALKYFDVRQRPWYIEGSSSPKDMVIILDLSGSVIGNRFLIIKLAVMTLLDTLQENDFVNIIYFNKEAYYVKKSWPLLVQATERNKKILKAAIQTLSGTQIANVDTGFKLAFKILQDSRDNSTNSTSKCTQSIAFFTDGVEGDTVADDVFSEYNSKKKVRVFTYLVGREKGTPFKAVKWIACSNKGYFYRIETLSDVRMNIVKYINVLSRSLIQERKPKWTPLYRDAQGLGMMTALVAPIFDTTDASVKRGKQLGVVGMDVTLEEIMSKIPDYKLGVGGYAFAITNNGFLFFHPRMQEMTGVNLKNPHSILLSEVERHFHKDGGFIKELMEAMIDKEKGSKKTNSVDNYILAKYNEKFIIVKRKLKYFYDHITNTSFSVGIALKDPGLQSINPGDNVFTNVAELKQLNENDKYNISAANWSYCETDNATENWQQLRELLKVNDLNKCPNKELMKLLLYDLKKMQNWDPIMSPNVSAVFFGTMSGLTFFKSKDNITFGNPIKQEYFERAADDWEKIVFSVHGNEVRASKVVPVKVNGKLEAVWGVAGVQILPESLQSILKKSTSSKCYLVDENGYIIVSGQETNTTGEFLGKVEGLVMKDLIDKEIFKKYNFTDVQGACKVATDDSSSSIRILDPLFALVNFAKWWTKTVALSFIQYSLYSIMTGMNQVKADDAGSVSETSCFKKMDLYFREDSFPGVIRNESLNGFQYSYESHMVEETNLMLIIVNKTQFDKKLSNDAVEIDCTVDEGECELRDNYRQLPEESSGCVPHADEIIECSAGKSLLPSLLLVVLQVIIFLKSS